MKRILDMDEFSTDKIYYSTVGFDFPFNIYDELDFGRDYYLVKLRSGWRKQYYPNFSTRDKLNNRFHISKRAGIPYEIYEVTEDEMNSILILGELEK